MSKCTSLAIEIVASHNSEPPASVGNSVSGAQADDNGNMSLVLVG